MKVRLSAGVVCAVFVALLASPASAASVTAAPTMVEAASWIAGHPVTVACDADVNQSPFQAPAGREATAWTLIGGNVIHVYPAFCDASSAPIGSVQFAQALDVFIHEAAHASGTRVESCAELTADIGVYDVLRRFYAIPFFSQMSATIGAQVLADTRTLSAAYQPEACWQSGRLS